MMIKGVSALLSAPSSATTAMRRGRRVRGRTMHQRKQHEPGGGWWETRYIYHESHHLRSLVTILLLGARWNLMAAHGRRRRTMNALLALNMLEFYSSSMMIKGVSALLSAPSSATTAMRRGRRVRGRTMHQRKQHEPLHSIPLTLQIMDASTTMIHHIPTFLSSFVDFPSDYFLHPHHSIITSSSSALLSDVSSATATSLTPQSHHVPHMTVNA
jgi:hypothetical protein